LQLPSGGDGDSILQKSQIIVFKPDFAKLIGCFQGEESAVHFTGAQGREPHVVGIGTQLGTEMSLC